MGWLELLPLLRRVLPLLDRLAPMLESLVAGRVGGRAAAEANSSSFSELTKGSATMQVALDEQARLLSDLNAQMGDLRTELARAQTHAAELAAQTTKVYRSVRLLAVLALVLVALCLSLLVVLVARHP